MNKQLKNDLDDLIFDLENFSSAADKELQKELEWMKMKLYNIRSAYCGNNIDDPNQKYYLGDEINDF